MPEEKKQLHVCGQCSEKFESEEAYLEHECKATGYHPTDIEHMEDSARISAAALERGEEKKKKEDEE